MGNVSVWRAITIFIIMITRIFKIQQSQELFYSSSSRVLNALKELCIIILRKKGKFHSFHCTKASICVCAYKKKPKPLSNVTYYISHLSDAFNDPISSWWAFRELEDMGKQEKLEKTSFSTIRHHHVFTLFSPILTQPQKSLLYFFLASTLEQSIFHVSENL